METKQQQVARQLRREYLRQWQKDNPDKVREANERYWLKKANEIMQSKNIGSVSK